MLQLHAECVAAGATQTCVLVQVAIIVATLLMNPVPNCAAAAHALFADGSSTMGRFALRVLNLWGVESARLPACFLSGEVIDAIRDVRARARGKLLFFDLTAKTMVRLRPGGPWRTLAELCGARPQAAPAPAPVAAAARPAVAPALVAPAVVPRAAAGPRLLAAPPNRPAAPPSPAPAKAYVAPSPPTPSEVPSAPSPAALEPTPVDVDDKEE